MDAVRAAFALALGLAVTGRAAQQDTILTNGRNLQIPINHGLPDKPLGFTFCRLRYQNIRRRESRAGATTTRKRTTTSWCVSPSDQDDDQPVEQWRPRFRERHRHGSRLFRCPYLRMQERGQLRLHT